MSRPLVGRDAECAMLRQRLTAAAGPVVLVAGEAGAGKTTLVERVLAEAGVPALRGRAAQWPGPAYDVLAQALRDIPVAFVNDDRETLAQIRPDLAQAPAETTTAALAGAVRRVLAEAAGGGPLAVFLDDLQWADEASLGLLPALADAVSGTTVSLVGCYRSDELPRGHGLRTVRAMLRRNHQLSHVDLGPLGDDDVRRMLTGLLGAPVRPALASVVASRADGLPFVV